MGKIQGKDRGGGGEEEDISYSEGRVMHWREMWVWTSPSFLASKWVIWRTEPDLQDINNTLHP